MPSLFPNVTLQSIGSPKFWRSGELDFWIQCSPGVRITTSTLFSGIGPVLSDLEHVWGTCSCCSSVDDIVNHLEESTAELLYNTVDRICERAILSYTSPGFYKLELSVSHCLAFSTNCKPEATSARFIQPPSHYTHPYIPLLPPNHSQAGFILPEPPPTSLFPRIHRVRSNNIIITTLQNAGRIIRGWPPTAIVVLAACHIRNHDLTLFLRSPDGSVSSPRRFVRWRIRA